MMINFINSCKYKSLIFLIGLVILFVSLPSLSFWTVPVPDIGNQGEAPQVALNCEAFPGFINKIIKCITHITSREIIEDNLDRLHSVMVYISNGAIIMFIMFFGLRMMFLGVTNLKKEMFLIVLTGFLVMWFNSTANLIRVMDIFVKAQSEFANAVTTSIATSPRYNEDRDGDGNPDPLCFGPLDEDGNYQATVSYSIWQRVDCLIGYILGAHPIVEYFGQQLNEYEADIPGDDDRKAVTRAKFSYEWVAGSHGFSDMATDPYEFFQNGAKKEGEYEVFISFSMIVIAISMLFNDGVGIIVILTGLFLVFLMIAAFGQAAFVYITSLFAIIVLFLFAPLMIPCFLFRTTKQIFNFWLQAIFAYTLVPGILLAYLSFMIFVIQFVLQYKGNNDDGFTLVDYHLGEAYLKADRNPKPLITYTRDNDGTIQMELERGEMNERMTDTMKDVEDRVENIDTDPLRNRTIANEESFRNYLEGRGITDLNRFGLGGSVSGSLQNFINIPGFVFGGFKYEDLVVDPVTGQTMGERYPDAKLDDAQVRSVKEFVAQNMGVLSADPNMGNIMSSSDLDKIFVAYQNDLNEFIKKVNPDGSEENVIKQEMIRDLVVALNSEDYRNKVNYMHLLLIVFLVLSVTFAFMQNVLTFGHEMAGAATAAPSRAINLYNTAYNRIYKSVNN